MKLGIVISTNDVETVWNAYRLGNYSLNEGDRVKAFLIGRGVESEVEHTHYNIGEQITKFLEAGGEIYACGTCMKSRKIEGRNTCPISTMKDLYQIIKESDKILTFGS